MTICNVNSQQPLKLNWYLQISKSCSDFPYWLGAFFSSLSERGSCWRLVQCPWLVHLWSAFSLEVLASLAFAFSLQRYVLKDFGHVFCRTSCSLGFAGYLFCPLYFLCCWLETRDLIWGMFDIFWGGQCRNICQVLKYAVIVWYP